MKVREFPLALALAAALALVAAAALQPVAADPNAPFAWEIQGPKAKHYLLGSVHLLPQTAEQLPDGIEDMYDAAEGLIFETDIGAIESSQVQSGLMTAAHSVRGLKAEVGAPLYVRLQAYITHIGINKDVCESYKAWFCALALEVLNYQKAGFTGKNGIDEQIYSGAADDDKAVRWFESPETHLALFTDMPDDLAKRLLESSIDESDAGAADEPAMLFKAWRSDDFSSIEKIVRDLKAAYPEIYQRLLAQRNHAWLPQLKQALDGDSSQLIVVGAAHLAGPDGLIALLRARGYKVQPYVTLPEPQLQAGVTPRLQSVALGQHR